MIEYTMIEREHQLQRRQERAQWLSETPEQREERLRRRRERERETELGMLMNVQNTDQIRCYVHSQEREIGQ